MLGGVFGSTGYGNEYATYTKTYQLKNCYNAGQIEGQNFVGGIAGESGSYEEKGTSEVVTIYGDIENCYNVGKVNGNSNHGGIVGLLNTSVNATITNSYYLGTTSDVAYMTDTETSSTKEGKTAEEMKTSTFIELLNAGNTETIWKSDKGNINGGYPYLEI